MQLIAILAAFINNRQIIKMRFRNNEQGWEEKFYASLKPWRSLVGYQTLVLIHYLWALLSTCKLNWITTSCTFFKSLHPILDSYIYSVSGTDLQNKTNCSSFPNLVSLRMKTCLPSFWELLFMNYLASWSWMTGRCHCLELLLCDTWEVYCKLHIFCALLLKITMTVALQCVPSPKNIQTEIGNSSDCHCCSLLSKGKPNI